MIYAHVNMDECSCSTKYTEEKIEVKEPGIYERTRETRQILTEVLFMLDEFKREIRNYEIPNDEKAFEPVCFKDEVACVNSLAFAIKGDLSRLMCEFR